MKQMFTNNYHEYYWHYAFKVKFHRINLILYTENWVGGGGGGGLAMYSPNPKRCTHQSAGTERELFT
jgi:hypothetical protein